MGAMSNHLEDKTERYLASLFGIIRCRNLSTETLQTYMRLWDGEYAMNGIPVSIIESELAWRSGTGTRTK